MASKIEVMTEEMVLSILPEEYELVDTEYTKEGSDWFLRILVDKKGEEGITLQDCQQLSYKISEMLDAKDPIKDPYFLEVSSPGLDRPLRKSRDFIREKGKEVELKLFKAVEGQKEFDGILEGMTDDQMVVIKKNDQIVEFNKKDIAIIRLKVNF